MNNNIAISVKNLSKKYQLYETSKHRLKEALHPFRKKYHHDFWALRDVSFEVKRGETLGIIGRNGSGKSTLLQIIYGTMIPTHGEVEVNGRVAALLELGAGFNPEFTGKENVYMNGAIMGLGRKEMDEKYQDIIDFAEIGDFIDQPVKTYSSGMYVRLAFAVAINIVSDILVIDEALAVGDVFFVQKCMRFMRKFREQGTILFVSHDHGAVLNLCHNAIWLEKGKVHNKGPAKEVCESYLEAFYENQHGFSQPTKNNIIDVETEDTIANGILKDQRMDFINHSSFRNDIEIFTFDYDVHSFGKGGARIIDVYFLSKEKLKLSWIVGGELVVLVVLAKAEQEIFGPIIGFAVKDRLGQTLFSDTTYMPYVKGPLRIKSGEIIEAQFSFQMPVLPVGDYTVTVAIAEGTLTVHVQHHWLADSLKFKSHTSRVITGLVGVPMFDISLKKLTKK